MTIKIDFSAPRQTRWYEYSVRFLFGGAITVAAGLFAKHYGPAFGGLFLAFPAIFPASATLVEKHENQKKRRGGYRVQSRGRKSAALDARGATWGSLGLACFAITVWKSLVVWNAGWSLVTALAAWLLLSVVAWHIAKFHRLARR